MSNSFNYINNYIFNYVIIFNFFSIILMTIKLTWFGFVLDYVLGNRAVPVLTGRPTQINVTTAFLDHMKISWKVWRLYINTIL